MKDQQPGIKVPGRSPDRIAGLHCLGGWRAGGFALVVTLSLMLLLTVIVVGLLGLSSAALRTSSQASAQAEAMANARLALAMAIGELQRTVGSDGNITAPAGILDGNPDTPRIEGVNHPHLTGVWAARNERLEDMPDYDRAGPFRRWLVSNDDRDAVEGLDFARQGSLSDPVLMVNPPVSRQADQADGKVHAGRVRVDGGAFAWWVGDENCKARVGQRDDLDREETSRVADLLVGAATPGTHGIRALEDFGEFPSNTGISDKIISRGLLDLAKPDGTPPAEFFHDLTPYSEGVLANVTDGSLRKDLSLYLERDDIDWLEGWGRAEGKARPPAGPLGANGEIALSHPRDYDVLSWKSLHHWYNMHRRQLKTGNGFPLASVQNYRPLDKVSNPTWNSGVMSVKPLIVRMQMLLSYGVRKKGPSPASRGQFDYDLFMYSYPVLTLWNPYSVALEVDQWSVFLHTMPLEHTVHLNGRKRTLTGGGTRNGNYNWGWPHGNMVMRFGDAGTRGITFEPGEAKTLTYTSAQSGGFHAHDMVAEVKPWLPPSHVGQQRHLGTITARESDRLQIETSGDSWATSQNSYNQLQTTFGFRCESKAVHAGHPDRFRRQMFISQVSWRREVDRGNPVADFISRENFPSLTLAELDNAPTPFIHLDLRLKTLDEPRLPNKTWLHTIPTHPFVSSTSTEKHRRQGVDGATTFFAHPYNVTFEQISGVEGLIQNTPFFGPSNTPAGRSVIVGQDIPLAPLTSLAQLQNLPQYPIEGLNWSGYYFQNHAIGNSHASPGLAPQDIKERSFPFYLGQYFAWQAGDIAGKIYDNWTWFNNDDYVIDAAPAAVIDRSYAANHLLFDDYFFSSMAAQQGDIFKSYGSERSLRQVVQEFFDGTKPLPNAAYRAHPGMEDGASVVNSLVNSRGTIPADAHLRAAAHLMATGSFNVNSTSVPAWTAMLGSTHLKRPVTMKRGRLVAEDRARFVVSRFSAPLGSAADNSSDAAAENNRWLGYRELTDDEVRQLAAAIVKQVKKRGPFRSLGEFVNRRRSSEPELAVQGALQAALEDPDVTINENYRDDQITLGDLQQGGASANYKFMEAALGSRYQGTPAYISQADILTPIAPIISARSDSFLVRGYGEARSTDGNEILARAWCEAVVQRVPEYLDPADKAHTPRAALESEANKNFGRRFITKGFRWLPSSEIENPEDFS